MSFERLALSVSVLLFVTLGGCASSTVDEAVPADDGGAGSSDVSGGDQTGDDGDQSGDDGGESGGGSVATSIYLDGTETCPERGYFLDVTRFDGPGDAYDAPELDVQCDDATLVVTSNGLPHYEYVQITPNVLRSQNFTWRIPRSPVLAESTTTIPLLGTVAFSINGIPIYGPNEAERPDPYGDPVYNDILDECLGHTGGRGDYHYHALLVRCLSGIGFDGQEDPTAASPLIGYALDGFPIFGPYGCTDEACANIVEFRSGWEQTGDPTTYAWDNHEYRSSDDIEVLDQCNGRIGPDGTYRYHATVSFPYILGCYAGAVGTQDQGGNEAGMPDNNGQNGPTACEEQSDCEAEGACPTELGCECSQAPMGQVCIPRCTTDADCEFGANRPLVCGDEGLCVPAN